jgi:DNA replication protein DnaC
MYYLSFTDGIPIAKYRDKIIYITEEKDTNFEHDDILDLIEEYDLLDMKMSARDIEEIRESLIDDKEPKNKKLRSLYEEIKEVIDDKKDREFNVYDSEITMIPTKRREVIYVCGKSGSGKSHITGQYIKSYNKYFPDREVLLFSTVHDDPSLKGLKVLKVNLLKMEEDGISVDEIKPDSLVVFDDIDTITNKNILNNVQNLMNQILETGRHNNIYCIITSHLINDYKRTRTIMNELNRVVLFPCGSSKSNIEYFCKKYLGFSKDQINDIHKLKSRHVVISNTVPQYVLCSNKIYLI